MSTGSFVRMKTDSVSACHESVLDQEFVYRGYVRFSFGKHPFVQIARYLET